MRRYIFFILLFTGFLFAQSLVIPVWSDSIPGSIQSSVFHEETITIENGQKRIKKVTNPTLAVYFPERTKMTGMAVIICPGGGYERLAYDHEGIEIAQKLNEYGITGIVLKYRLPNDTIMREKKNGPLADAQEAMRLVRRHANEWQLNSNKIGVAGFSAGGHLASTLSTKYLDQIYPSDTTSARPDFSILVYPVISMDAKICHSGSRKKLLGTNPDGELCKQFSGEMLVNADTPPAFLVHASDDPSVPVQNSIVYFDALNKYKIPSELHIYQKGGHGFGLAKDKGTTADWFQSCIAWLKEIERNK